jgi:transketolase
MTSTTTGPFTVTLGAATRDAFGQALRDVGRDNPRVVVVDGDVGNSTRTEWFAQAFPDRAFNVGIAESNMVGVAAGLAANGHIPVVASFAAFILCNAYDQMRMSIAFPGLNVKVVGTHAGISIGEDGPSQMAIEDLALAGALPGFVVAVPADEAHARAATRAMVAHDGPVYLRFGRPKAAHVYAPDASFEFGRAYQLRDGHDLTIVACGLMTAEALLAHDALAASGIHVRVIDMPTIKPLDVAALERAARETGRILVAEEHLSHGGLGSAVAMAVGAAHPCRLGFVNLGDRFAESGTPEALLKKYGLTAGNITAAARALVA